MVRVLQVIQAVKVAEIIRQKNKYSPPSGGDKFKERVSFRGLRFYAACRKV